MAGRAVAVVAAAVGEAQAAMAEDPRRAVLSAVVKPAHALRNIPAGIILFLQKRDAAVMRAVKHIAKPACLLHTCRKKP